MQTKVAHLLLFLLIWSQVDDVLLPPQTISQSAPLANDDDEYQLTRLSEAWGRSSLEQSRLPERRQVTVISCDLLVSGPQSARLDPEDLQAAIAACSAA